MSEQATLDDFVSWVNRDIGRYVHPSAGVEVVERNPDKLSIRLYSSTHSYSISASPRSVSGRAGGYLGCISTCRTHLAGEDWLRGCDLADGPLSEDTWRRILADIVALELVPVEHHKQPKWDYAT